MKIRTILFLICAALSAIFSEASEQSMEFARDLIRYLGIESKASPKDIETIATLKERAEDARISDEERKKAYNELFAEMARIQGSNNPAPLMEYFVSTALSWHCEGERAVLPQQPATPGELPQVILRGSGKVPAILLPDLGFDGSVFQPFMERNQKFFRMYAVTLPGFGGTAPLPRFEKRDYPQKRLWRNAEKAVLNLILKEKLKQVVLIGQQAGAYLALRIALDHPEFVKSVVVLNGLLYAPLSRNSSSTVPLADRERIANLSMPVELFPRPSRECYYKYWISLASMYSKDPARAKALSEIGAGADAYSFWDYFVELMSTDLSEEITKLKAPLLVIPSITDPAQKPAALVQWQSVELPSIKIAPVEDTGAFSTEDQPETVDRLIIDFASDSASN